MGVYDITDGRFTGTKGVTTRRGNYIIPVESDRAEERDSYSSGHMIIMNLLSDPGEKYDLHYNLQNGQKTRDSVGECALWGIPDRFLIGCNLP